MMQKLTPEFLKSIGISPYSRMVVGTEKHSWYIDAKDCTLPELLRNLSFTLELHCGLYRLSYNLEIKKTCNQIAILKGLYHAE